MDWGLVYLMGELLPLHTGSLSPQPVLALLQVSLGRGLQQSSLFWQPVHCGCSACGRAWLLCGT